VGPGSVFNVHCVADGWQLAARARLALIRVTPDDVIDLLVNFAPGIEPSFDDLDAIEIRANGIFQRGDEECRRLAGGSVAQITPHGNALGVADGRAGVLGRPYSGITRGRYFPIHDRHAGLWIVNEGLGQTLRTWLLWRGLA